jgi:hypothetical protein
MKRFIFLLILACSLTHVASQDFKEFNFYWTGSDPNNQIGSAGNQAWRLTYKVNSVKSAIWNSESSNSKSRNLNMIDSNFCIEFQLQFSIYQNADDWVGADGFAFVLRNPSIMYNDIGGDGRGIGYQYIAEAPLQPGITHSLAVEFDTYYNDSYDQKIDNKENVDHIAYYYTYTVPVRLGSDVNINPNDDDVEDAKFHYVKIVWEKDGLGGGTLSTYYGDEAIARKSIYLNSTQVADIGGRTVKWGFTSATKASKNQHTLIMSDLKQ